MPTPVKTVDKSEVERFAGNAAEWWNQRGPFATLHQITPIRLAYLREEILRHFGGDPRSPRPFAGVSVVDIGCGGGLVAEPLTRLGASVTGVDPGAENIAAAEAHALAQRLPIEYRAGTSHDLVAEGRQFDCVVALEVIEHVPDVDSFLASCAALVRPGGLVMFSTLNRTAKAFALLIVGAEYILRWLPRGTHRWDRFVTPEEMDSAFRRTGLTPTGQRGMVLNPLNGAWRLDDGDLDVNYFAAATKPSGQQPG
jgi:2-polyprenyl-6-hydroxyphenyl methylase / 3-demethylubiquinone-9 3-methyltransferase